MKTSTFHELNSVLLGLNQAVQPEVLNKEEITERIAFLQANRKRIAGSGYYGNMNHSFKLKGNKDYNSKVKEEYDDCYYEMRSLKCKLKLMDIQSR